MSAAGRADRKVDGGFHFVTGPARRGAYPSDVHVATPAESTSPQELSPAAASPVGCRRGRCLGAVALRRGAPCLTVAIVIVAASAIAYDEGASAWVVNVAILVACLVTLPVEEQWERRRRQRSGE